MFLIELTFRILTLVWFTSWNIDIINNSLRKD